MLLLFVLELLQIFWIDLFSKIHIAMAYCSPKSTYYIHISLQLQVSYFDFKKKIVPITKAMTKSGELKYGSFGDIQGVTRKQIYNFLCSHQNENSKRYQMLISKSILL